MLILSAIIQAEDDVALITALEGKVTRDGSIAGALVEPFVKLKENDVLNISKGSYLQLVYFANGRQESWKGAGKLEITTIASRATGLPAPQIQNIPLIIVTRLARTPSLNSQSRAGVTRLRSIPSPDAIILVETTYQNMRKTATRDDLNPELYFLGGMFDLKQFDKVAQFLNQLKQDQPHNKSVKILIDIYSQALRDAHPGG